ncbi:MAG TPA: hypothetical protein VNX40_08730 [Mucilaginibacter sp.]|nr:hypothetical protein [Mucilaginibacter sp.]
MKNHLAFRERSDSKLLYFNWSLHGNILTLKHTLKKDNNDIIADGNYVIARANNKEFNELDLLDTQKHIKYILAR